MATRSANTSAINPYKTYQNFARLSFDVTPDVNITPR
jgi:hypothetical protein